MSSPLSLFCSRIIEAGWLIALIVVPLFFNHRSTHIFEPDKIVLLRSIAVIMGLAWLVKAGAAWRIHTAKSSPEAARSPELRLPGRALTRHPIVVATFLFLAVYTVATGASILPRLSLWGYDERLYGLYTAGAYAVVFFSIVALLRTRKQARRLVTTALLASLPIALYGILQHLDADPLPWLDPLEGRAHATLGNPIFLGATLGMIVPLTLYRLAEAARRRRFILLGCYGVLLVLQVACILFTQSRGPVLGLTGSVLFGGLLWMLTRRRWRAARILLGTSIALATLLVVINLPNAPLGFVQDVPYLNRLTRVDDVKGSSQGRVLIWKGAVDLIGADPSKWALGYGPETIRFAYYPHYATELGLIHGWQVFFDRMHNETYDVLITTGGLGFLIYLLLFTSLAGVSLRRIGLLASSRQQSAFLAAWLGGGIALTLGLRIATQTWAYSGIALTLGLLGGLFLYLAGYTVYAARRAAPSEEAGSSDGVALLVIVLFSGILGHFIEINVGIAVSATRLLFWVYAALLVVPDVPLRERLDPLDASSTRQKKDAEAAQPGAASTAAMAVGLGVLVVTPAFSLTIRGMTTEIAGIVGGLLAATWMLAGLILWRETHAKSTARGSLRTGSVYAGLSLLPLLVLLLGRAVGVDASNHHLLLYYLIVLFALGGVAFALGREAPTPAYKTPRRAFALALAGALGAGVFLYKTSLQPMQASMLHAGARAALQQNRGALARATYRRALALAPRQERYQLELAQLLASEAYAPSASPAERDRLFATAESLLVQAAAANPFEQYHPAALADVYRFWAERTIDPQQRAARYEQAADAFDKALHINPENALILRNRAALYEQVGNRTQALATYRQILAWDSTDALLYLQLGDLYRTTQQWAEAAEMYEGTIRHSARPRSATHLALAIVYQQLARLEDAIRQSRRAIALDPDVVVYREILIGLYQVAGRCPEALEQLQEARRRWPGNKALAADAASLAQQCRPRPDAE